MLIPIVFFINDFERKEKEKNSSTKVNKFWIKNKNLKITPKSNVLRKYCLFYRFMLDLESGKHISQFNFKAKIFILNW
ncbi:hypothetical protein DERP_002219 [Dermatophagoides pteronyssinus]|uniref:Uncharacterized protein n=1 Tax=Dermatophagoides pteronyssinus TaxID=6956 RepID=A0ABQ8JH58_DERPT|nr:hypothetical protein DERP_002219 [Dermatophagoides pteronyssinus]